VLLALAVGAIGVVLSPVAAYASTSSNISGPTSADQVAANAYGPNVYPFNSACTSGQMAAGAIAYVGSFAIGAGAANGKTLDAGAPYHPCFYSSNGYFFIDMSGVVGSGQEVTALNSGAASYQLYWGGYQVTSLGLAQIAAGWQGDMCTAPGGTETSVCGSPGAVPSGLITSSITAVTGIQPCPGSSVPSSYYCVTFTDSGTGTLSTMPSGDFVECYESITDYYIGGSWVPAGYSCAVFGYGAQATPLNLSCSVAANASNGMVNFNYSDGAKYGWTAAVTASASGASPASGSGGDTGAFTTVLPVSAVQSQVQVVWSSGSTFEGTCEKAVNFYPSGTGGRSGGAGSGVAAGAPAGSFNFSACAPSGFGWLNPIALLKGFGCLLQGLFVPTTNDLNSLYSVIQISPFMSALISAPSRITAAATSWSPVFGFGSFTFSGSGRSLSVGSMTLPSISANGYISVAVECIVGVADLALLISVFS
jgi:hypothetical protein